MTKKQTSPTATLAAVLLTSLCFSAQAQQQSSTPAKADEVTTGTINGRVVNEIGQPLPGATVFIRAVNSVTTGRTTATDSEGNFRVSVLDPALYTISANSPAYTTLPSDTDAPATYYRIGDSVRLEMVRGGVVTGTVTNAAGEPIVAIRVRAAMIRDAKGQSPKLPSFSFIERTTDDRGVYRIYGLSPGTYLVSAGGAGTFQPFQVNPYDSDTPTYSPSSTRDNAAEISVRGGEESNADIRYRGEPGHTISGTVKTTGVNGASIMLTPAGSSPMAGGNGFQPAGSRGFAFTGMADGDYDLAAQEVTSAPSSFAPELSFSESRRVTVKGADVTGIELIPKPLASLSGRISLEPSQIPDCQGKRRPSFKETLVTLQRHEKDSEKDSSMYLRLFANSGSPDQTGTFVVRNLLPGRYQFNAKFFARYWYLRSMTLTAGSSGTPPTKSPTNSRIDAAANWTIVKAGEQIKNLNITLAEGAAAIRGQLTAAEDQKLPSGLSVYLVPAEREKAEDVLRFFVTEVAADGTFAFTNLPPGRYWSLAQTPVEKQTSTLVRLRLPETAEARGKLRRAAETIKTDIELKPCQNMTDFKLPLK